VVVKGSAFVPFVVRKDESSNKTIRMPDSLIAGLEKIASDKDISFNKLVIQCCEYAIDNINEDRIE
jgi:predicted HicB family RNase H-like nuclease